MTDITAQLASNQLCIQLMRPSTAVLARCVNENDASLANE